MLPKVKSNIRVPYTVYVVIEVQCTSARANGCASINFNNNACRPVPTICIYTVNRNRVDLCLQGSGDLCMCCSQTDWNTARILVFLDNLFMFFQAFGVNLMCFVLQGRACLLGHVLV